MFVKNWMIGILALSLLLVGCSDSTSTKIYTADNALEWLQGSNLVSEDGEYITALVSEDVEDVTAKYEDEDSEYYEGLVKAFETPEAHILEFEKEEQASEKADGFYGSFAVKTIYILLKKQQNNADNFIKVLESAKPIESLEVIYDSDEQKKFAEMATNGADFLPLINAYYDLSDKDKNPIGSTYFRNHTVTWTGTIADLDEIQDSIILYSGDNYNGEDYPTIRFEKKEMLPYTILVELKDEDMKYGLENGDRITIKGKIYTMGSKEFTNYWKLVEGEVVN